MSHKSYGVCLGKHTRKQSGMAALSVTQRDWQKQTEDRNKKVKLIQLSYRVISVSKSPFKVYVIGLKVTHSKISLQSPHFQGTLRGASTGTCMGISDSKCIEVAQRAGLSTPDLQDSREPCPREASQCLPVLWALCWTARELRSLAKS